MTQAVADPTTDEAAAAAAAATAAAEAAVSEDAATDGDEGAAQLGDAGKKALDDMKGKWHSERDRRKAMEQELAALKAPKAATDDATPDIDAIRTAAKAEAKAEALRDKALDKIEAKAARLLKNPDDARRFLGDSLDDFIDDGQVDVDAISDAIAKLVEERPYLGVTQGEPKRFEGTGDGGPKGSPGKPQLTDADVKRLYKQGKHAEIEAARRDGRLNTLLGITT